jgi:hypothetical protein
MVSQISMQLLLNLLAETMAAACLLRFACMLLLQQYRWQGGPMIAC